MAPADKVKPQRKNILFTSNNVKKKNKKEK
jgi:hypothetical protein